MFSIRMMIPIFDYSYSISDLGGQGRIYAQFLILKLIVPLLSVVSLEPKPNIAGENKHSVLIQE